jgi:predicted transcriptional regulator
VLGAQRAAAAGGTVKGNPAGIKMPASEANAMSTAKEELTRLIETQPDESSSEEIVRELAFHVMVQRGLADSEAKRVISNEEMGRRIRSWRK